jgi:hypothetical protein
MELSHEIGFFNEADTLESNSVLIYLHSVVGNVRDVLVPNVDKCPQLLFIFVIFLSH